MKVKITMEIDIPDGMIPEDSSEMATIKNILYEGTVGYAHRCHITDSWKWEEKAEQEMDEVKKLVYRKVWTQHDAWASAFMLGMDTFTVEKL